jgi:LPS export ABC transporter protein LptC
MISVYKKRIAAFFMGCFFLLGCENDINEVRNLSLAKIGVEEGKGITINYSINGKQKAMLKAPLMYRVQDTVPYIEFPKTIHVDFFDVHDSIESRLDAKYAKYKESQSRVFLKDSVRVINTSGDTLYCDELYWDRNRVNTEFYTEKPVRIRTKTHIINGIGMDARQDFKEWHIIQSTGFLKVPSTEFPD